MVARDVAGRERGGAGHAGDEPRARAARSTPVTGTERPWTDAARELDDRVEALLADMTLEEKLAQLASVWVGREGEGDAVAPEQDRMASNRAFEEITEHGIGHLTRVFGTNPIEPADGARRLAELQSDLVARTRHGLPAIAHEECLTGFTTFRATVYPTPLAWAATFDADAVERMAAAIGAGMFALGVHQGLSPVLDVVRDHRWGRVEETLGEDPYVVGMLAAAYVRGLESTGLVATLKHFAGYSGSRAGRNLAPTMMGPRELADVILPPFEMALRDGRPRSVMHSYAEIDGVPAAADEHLLTGLLRDEWGFEGVVVADYFGISFLETLHRVAADAGEAGALALRAGVDVELPSTRCYAAPLAGRVRAGDVPEALVDRAVRRVLRQKGELGLLDADWAPAPPPSEIELDPPASRALARELAEASVVLLDNRDGLLPLRDDARRIAVVGPGADDPLVFLGCYSFPNHVLARRGATDLGIAVPSLLAALREELPEPRARPRAGLPRARRGPLGHRGGRRGGAGRRPLRRGRRRPRRDVRQRHLGRGLRRRGPRAAGRAAGAARRARRDGHAAARGGDLGPAVRARALGGPAWRARCRPSSAARRAARRSRASSRGA